MADTPTRYQGYENPLVERYASRDMSWLFSPQYKFQTWRRLWVALAEAEAEVGLDISQEQIAELRAHIEDINFAVAEEQEKKLRHDVMAQFMPTANSAQRLAASSISGPPVRSWATIPISFRCGQPCSSCGPDW